LGLNKIVPGSSFFIRRRGPTVNALFHEYYLIQTVYYSKFIKYFSYFYLIISEPDCRDAALLMRPERDENMATTLQIFG
jgi:hypothetical protein